MFTGYAGYAQSLCHILLDAVTPLCYLRSWSLHNGLNSPQQYIWVVILVGTGILYTLWLSVTLRFRRFVLL